MKRRTNSKVLIWGVAATVLAAAFLLALVRLGSAAEEPVIDTAAPVLQQQCLPCHADLSEVTVPGLKFSHGSHLLVSCDGCHDRMPHRDDQTDRIPMEVCFACHGIQHGPQGELATSECRDCHTKSFDLRPSDHTSQWAEQPHVEASKAQGVNSCMMCHDAPKDCDPCHAEKASEVATMPPVYHTVINPRPKGPSIKIYPDGPVTMSQCQYCHTDIDAIPKGRLIFAHSAHVSRNYRCEACHEEFPHNEEGVTKPDMQSCYRCHGLVHASEGLVATEECGKCHPKEFELMPSDHTKRFITKTHGRKADKDLAYCAMCHKSEFCVVCHRGQGVGEYASSEPVIPADHRKAKWMSSHGGKFMAGKGACVSCHTDESCKRCHKTPMPHPVNWIEDHAPAPGVPDSDCNICHQDRQACQECHHSKVQQGQLVAKACTPCHDEMKKKPPTSIKNKGFAEHAVHFNVYKEKGKPYTCDDCHIGYSTDGTQESLASAGHDVRLCYGCHGALDYRNRIIAPYAGAELCLKCHTDLGI